MKRSCPGIAASFCLTLGVALPGRLAADSWSNPSFGYVALWKQYHKDSMKIGLGTAELIHPRWVITAYHVAKFKHQNPDGGSTQILFFGGKYRNVSKVYKAPGVDIALAKLNSPINSIQPVALLKQSFRASDGVIDFTIAGRSGGLHYHRVRGESRLGGESFRVLGDPPGKAGDSGGFWGIERYGTLPHVQFAVLHGGGVAPQIGPISDWIDRIVGAGKVTWVTKSILRNGIPTDTHTWTGNGRYTTWTDQGNWDSGGTPGVSGSLASGNQEIARLRWMGDKADIHAAPRVESNWSLGRIEILAGKGHNLTIADSKNWNGSTGGGRRTILLNGKDGQAFHVHSDGSGAFTYTVAEGIRILVDNDLCWDVHGDETLRINGRVSGGGKITKRGTGTLTFANTKDTVTNNGSNPLEILGGTVVLAKKPNTTTIPGNICINGAGAALRLGQDEQISNAVAVSVHNGRFDLNGRTETIGSLVLNGGDVSGGTLNARAAHDLRSGSVSSSLAGSIGLHKTTAGTVTRSGADTYTGGTTIEAGVLLVNGTHGGGNGIGDYAVESGATLGGGGSIDANVIAANGGTLAPGRDARASIGTLTVGGDCSLSPGAIVEVELAGEAGEPRSDRIAVGRRATLGGTLAIRLLDGFRPTPGQTFTVLTAGSTDRAFERIDGADLGDDLRLEVYTGPTSVTIVAVRPPAVVVDVDALKGGTLNPNGPAPRSIGITRIEMNGYADGTLHALWAGTGSGGGWLRLRAAFGRTDAYADGDQPEWHRADEWAGVRLRGLAPDMPYTFQAKARNGEAETGLVDAGTCRTNLGCDVNRSGTVTALDYALIKSALLGNLGEDLVWPSDVDDSGRVNVLDLSRTRARVLNPPQSASTLPAEF